MFVNELDEEALQSLAADSARPKSRRLEAKKVGGMDTIDVKAIKSKAAKQSTTAKGKNATVTKGKDTKDMIGKDTAESSSVTVPATAGANAIEKTASSQKRKQAPFLLSIKRAKARHGSLESPIPRHEASDEHLLR